MSILSPPRYSTNHDLKNTVDMAGYSDENISHTSVPFDAEQESEPIVTRKELWSYYLYRSGNNSVGVTTFTLTLFQSLVTAAGYDPVVGPGSSCFSSNVSGQCVVPWMGGTKSVASVVLIANGIGSAIITVLCIFFGSAADYGTFGRWSLFTITAICWVVQYACIALTSSDRWILAMALYIIGYVCYIIALILSNAVYPRLARNTPRSRAFREKCKNGEVSAEDYEREKSLELSKISNLTMVYTFVGCTVTYLLNLALLLAPKTAHNPKVNNYTIVLDNSYWVLVGIWWFIFQLPRPGPPLPRGETYLTIGCKQIWKSLKTCKELSNTLLFTVVTFFLLGGLVTTEALVAICQNDQFKFSFLMNTYFGLVRAIPAVLGPLGCWYIQRYWKIKTKTMYFLTVAGLTLVPLWGVIGIWSKKFGLHNDWEFWVCNFVMGFCHTVYFAYSRTVFVELIPPGFENMFFTLSCLGDSSSAIVGPYIVEAIIDGTKSNWKGFPFLFAIPAAGVLVTSFGVNIEKGKRDAVKWAEMQGASAKQ